MEKIKNYSVFNLKDGLEKLTGFSNFKFNYALLKNARNIEVEIKLIQEAMKEAVTEDMTAVVGKIDEKRTSLKGTETVELADFLSEEEIKLHEEYNKVINDIMGQDSDFEVYKIDEEHVPNELTFEQSAIVMELIKD